MTQVSLSNVSLSFLKEQYNLIGNISFSDLYKYNTGISVFNELNISKLIGKYHTFLPTNLSQLINWYDASSLILDNLKNNDNISILKDLSGNNNDATQSLINNQPTFQKYGFNGKPSILFTDNISTNSKYLNFNTSTTPTEITIAVVFNTSFISTTSTTSTNNIFSTSTWNTGNILFEHNNMKNPNIKINTTLNNNNTIYSIINLDFSPKIYIIKYFIDTNDGYTKSQLRYNGINTDIFIHDNSLINLVLGDMTLGGTSTNYLNNLNGYISEFILYDRLLTDNEIFIMEGYLASKWWGIPSFILPTTHKYYNIEVLNSLNSPSLLYKFDNPTHTSNVCILRNDGLEGNLLDGIVRNLNYTIISSYYTGFNNHINSLFIWYKFDSTGNLIYLNNGYGGTIFNLVNPIGKSSYTFDYIRGDGTLKLSSIDKSITNSSINFSTFSNEYTFIFWYKVVSFNTSSDTLLSLSDSQNIGNEFYIQRENTTNNLIISIPNKIETIRLINAIKNDGFWRHISISLKKLNINDLIISIFLNGIIQYDNHIINGAWFINNTNYVVINQYSTTTSFGANMLYDDFRIYTKFLNEKETQSVMQYPITSQNGVRNTNSYIINTYNTNYLSEINIDYTSFINYFFVNGNTYTISYNLQILKDDLYTSDFDIIIIHCNYNNLNKLKIIHRYFNSSTSYIKIIISDTSTTNDVTEYFETIYNDNYLHNYIFIIPISLSGPNTIKLYTDTVLTNTVSITSSEPIINSTFVKLGTYYDTINTYNTSPYSLEDFKIYSRELQLNEIQYINTNYNLNPNILYYQSNLYPFNYITFNNSYGSSNAYGPSYSNLITNYSSNGSWIFNLDFFNSYNGIQQFTIPQSGYYKITTAGASGGSSYTENNYGKGIICTNIKYLNTNDILNILVGQKGGKGSYIKRNNDHDLHGQGGGGGGTFVALSNIPILISGGGGGSGEKISGGENAVGVNAVNTTYSSSDSGNYSVKAINGNGGELGIYGVSRGSGCGGGGFYTDGKNKISIYNGEYKGYSYLSYLTGSNIGIPFQTNIGGIGGFPGGATGGTNFSLDLVWGGGGGSGYSGGPGGSASYYQGQTLGGGGGGSFDINGIKNNATKNIKEGTLGYNDGNGYVKLQFLTFDHFLNYTNANDKISRDGLTLLIEPKNPYCYNSYSLPTAMTNLVDGSYAYLNNNYSYNNTNNSIRLYNISQNDNINLSYLHINPHSEIRTISIWYNVITTPTNNTYFLDTLQNSGYINKNVIGADWFNSLSDIGSGQGGIMYVDTSNQIKNINWNDIIYPLNTWRNITLISHSNITNDLILFANKQENGGMNVEIGPIMVYNKEISLSQHLFNYNIYGQLYNTPYKFYFIGVYQYFIVPDNIYNIKVKMWGSGGGGSRLVNGNGYGGAGTYLKATLNVFPKEKLKITVPSGGFAGLVSSRSSGGWPNGSSGGYESGGGGGFTSIQKENGEYLMIAASGAGAGYFYGTYDIINTVSYVQSQTCGGGGGNLITGKSPIIESGNPGLSSIGGLAYTTLLNNTQSAGNGGYLVAGIGGVNFGGGGGNGLYGGSGGGEKEFFVAGGSSGTSYCNPLYSSDIEIISGNNGNINNAQAPNNTDIDYPGSQIGDGGPAGGNNGRNGYVLIKLF